MAWSQVEVRAVEIRRSIAEPVSGASPLLWKFVRKKPLIEKYQTPFQVKKQLKMVVEITRTTRRVEINEEALPPPGVTSGT